MLTMMNHLFVPTALDNTTWPASMRTDIIGSLHKFMASLTEHAHETFGKTVLYIPHEDISDPASAAKDKALVQRLETSVIHWTRQIKEVVNYLDNSGACIASRVGPGGHCSRDGAQHGSGTAPLPQRRQRTMDRSGRSSSGQRGPRT